MRYRIFSDGQLIYDPSSDALSGITEANLQQEINRSGMFTFTLAPDHPAYSRIEKMKSIITLYSDNDLLFRGRVIQISDNFIRERHFMCEGELSFLLDSIHRPYEFKGTPGALLSELINNHNAYVEGWKQFTVGEVTVSDPNLEILRENEAYDNTLENLNQKLIDSLGGYLFINGDSSGNRIINWYSEPPNEATQRIEFGSNLLDINKLIDAEEMATALIPLGAEEESKGTGEKPKRLTIKEVNAGSDFIYDADAVDEYGWIFKVETWDDVTTARGLYNKAVNRLEELKASSMTIDLSAVDLATVNANIDKWRLGDKINVVSPPHGIDVTYVLTAQQLDLLHPENNHIKLGHTYKTFTDQALTNSTTSTKVEQIANRINIDYVATKDFEDATDSIAEQVSTTTTDILSEVASTYATITSLQGVAGNVSNLATQLNKIVLADISEIRFMRNDVDGECYIDFTASNVKYRLVIDGTGLSYYEFRSGAWSQIWTIPGTPVI